MFITNRALCSIKAYEQNTDKNLQLSVLPVEQVLCLALVVEGVRWGGGMVVVVKWFLFLKEEGNTNIMFANVAATNCCNFPCCDIMQVVYKQVFLFQLYPYSV